MTLGNEVNGRYIYLQIERVKEIKYRIIFIIAVTLLNRKT